MQQGLLAEHAHPTVRVFARTILSGERIEYDSDPYQDFGFGVFLERFWCGNVQEYEDGVGEESCSGC